MSLPRILSQVVILGSQILGKAFVEAYKQAARNARSGTSSSSSTSSSTGSNPTGSYLTRLHRLSVNEASQILHLNESINFALGPTNEVVSKELENMLQSYERMYKANETSSNYLLSKIIRARERIEAELTLGVPEDIATTGRTSSSTTTPPS